MSALLLLLACASEDPEPRAPEVDLVTRLSERGPHRVGYRLDTVTYSDRDLPSPIVDRTLRLALWYPTADTTGPIPRYNGLIEDPDAIGDATPLAGHTAPLMVFSHGHQGYAENSGFLMNHFASHGWVVAAPDHTGNTTFDGSDRDTPIYWQRPRDLSAVLDHVEGLSDLPTTGEVVATGHSFGGYTLLALAGATYDVDTLEVDCAAGTGPMPFCTSLDADGAATLRTDLSDDRIAGFVPMAPGDYALFGAEGIGEIRRPTLVMTGGLDGGTEGGGKPIAEALQGDHAWAHLPDAGHQTFTDFSGIDGEVDVEEAFRAIRTYALGWAYLALGSDEMGCLFDGDCPVSEVVELR